MDTSEQLDLLINTFKKEDPRFNNLEIPEAYPEKRQLFRSLMTIRPPRPLSNEFLNIQDEFLSKETLSKGIVDGIGLPTIANHSKFSLWQGDITTLKVDAIVNAANSQMLGCFVPGHQCIDNAIHSAAGVQLRLKCNQIMQAQAFPEPTGKAKITRAYNLPCRYVLHTVGPIIKRNLTGEDCKLLADCYRSCLELALKYQLTSIAFCCISTGEFHFPQQTAAEIAIQTVEQVMNKQSQIQRVVFNVFKPEDYTIYRKLLEPDQSSR